MPAATDSGAHVGLTLISLVVLRIDRLCELREQASCRNL